MASDEHSDKHPCCERRDISSALQTGECCRTYLHCSPLSMWSRSPRFLISEKQLQRRNNLQSHGLGEHLSDEDWIMEAAGISEIM